MNRLLLAGLGAFALSGCVVSSSAAGCDAGPGSAVVDSGSSGVDSGARPPDAGDTIDAGPIEDEVAHFVNLMDAPVEFKLEGDDAGVVVGPFAAATHKNKTGHVTLNRRLIATSQSDAGLSPMTGDVHFDALPLQGRVQGYAALVVAVGNSLSVVSELDTETEDVRSAATLGSSALALNLGVDLDGDCVADVGAKTGAAATVGYAAHDKDLICGTTDHFRCVRGKHFTGQLLETGHGQLRAAYWVRTGDTLEVASVVEDNRDSTPRVVLNEQLPWVSVVNLRTTRTPEAVGLGADSWSASLAPLQVVHLPPAMAEHALQGLGSVTLGGATLPFSTRGITGPCRPPYLCDTLLGTEALSLTPELAPKGAKNVLVVLEDTVATAVRLPDDSSALTAPSIVTIITGAAKARTSLCLGAVDVCNSPDAVSLELSAGELSPSIAMPVRSLMAPRLEHAAGLRVTEAAAAQGSKPLTWFAPPDFGTRPVASILIVASEAVVSDAADANLGKIIVTLDGKKKDYVGHVTLNR